MTNASIFDARAESVLFTVKPNRRELVDKEKLKEIPKSPGVYLHKDQLGKIIYVGKAKNLNSRVRQYFQSSKTLDGKTRALVRNIDDVSYITTTSEMEAFILECNLIKKYSPKYNILLKDDKSYPYIKVSTSENFPRIYSTRTYEKNKDLYFGPYSDVKAVNNIIDFINNVIPTKKCNKQSFKDGEKACLNFHIEKCKGICQGEISKEEYGDLIEIVVDFLRGKDKSLDKYLEKKMYEASANMKYEEAIQYRNFLKAAKAIREKQSVELRKSEEVDVVLYGDDGKVVVFSVLDNRLVDRQIYIIEGVIDEGDSEEKIILEFIKQHYSEESKGPKQILIDNKKIYIDKSKLETDNNKNYIDKSKSENYKDEINMIENYLETLWGRKVKIYSPVRGEKAQLLKMAKLDLIEQKKNLNEKIEKNENREKRLKDELSLFGEFPVKPRIEAYDISHTFGVDAVGVEVVFVGSKPEKKQYRKFKIKTKDENGKSFDDYGNTQEVLYRRIKKAMNEEKAFLPLPDIIILDGGKGHLEAGRQVVEAMINMAEKEGKREIETDLKKIVLIGLAKDNKHRTEKAIYFSEKQNYKKDGKNTKELDLKTNKLLYTFFGNIQEEVHRFAIAYHKNTRNIVTVKSELENIEGIGKVKRNRLLNHFGSIKNLKKASIEEIKKVEGINEKDARAICKYFDI